MSSSTSEITLTGCYFHGLDTSKYDRNAQAVALTMKSVANISKNYIFRTGNGISCWDSDLTCQDNLILNCCQERPQQPSDNSNETLESSSNINTNGNGHTNSNSEAASSSSAASTSLGLFTGICVKSKGNKVQIVDNTIKRCDIGVYVGNCANPVIKDNTITNSNFTGVFAEYESKANIVSNVFNGGSKDVVQHCGKGLGVLLISSSSGLIGKNVFEDFEVSPVMIFSTCHPLLKGNCFSNINVNDEKQKNVETQMLEQFQAELFKKDEYFYIVDGDTTERELAEVILKSNK